MHLRKQRKKERLLLNYINISRSKLLLPLSRRRLPSSYFELWTVLSRQKIIKCSQMWVEIELTLERLCTDNIVEIELTLERLCTDNIVETELTLERLCTEFWKHKLVQSVIPVTVLTCTISGQISLKCHLETYLVCFLLNPSPLKQDSTVEVKNVIDTVQ